MTQSSVPKLITPGVIAEELGAPLHRVLHVLATRHHIQPQATAGNARLYDRRAIKTVRTELDAIDARRRQGMGGEKSLSKRDRKMVEAWWCVLKTARGVNDAITEARAIGALRKYGVIIDDPDENPAGGD